MKRKRVRSERWRLGSFNARLPHKTTKTINKQLQTDNRASYAFLKQGKFWTTME